jgi:hypothetical protein
MIKSKEFFEFNNSVYRKIIPCKTLFRSTTIHEVVNRGDIFALNLTTGVFTVLPGAALIQNAKSNENSDIMANTNVTSQKGRRSKKAE